MNLGLEVLGLTRSLALTPFGPNKGRTRSTLMGTGGTSSPPGADTFAATQECWQVSNPSRRATRTSASEHATSRGLRGRGTLRCGIELFSARTGAMRGSAGERVTSLGLRGRGTLYCGLRGRGTQ